MHRRVVDFFARTGQAIQDIFIRYILHYTVLFLGWLLRFLIGAPVERERTGRGGTAGFIQHVLVYWKLFVRLTIAALVWIVSWWQDLTFVAKVAFLFAELYGSLLLIRFSAGFALSESRWPVVLNLLNSLFSFQNFLKPDFLKGVWLPLAVVGVAAWFLIVNDQGRDLGVGLMGAHHAAFFALAVILIYWALNTWHCARIGLNRRFPRPEKRDTRLFWGPRFLGVSAHMLAGLSLSFAARNQPELLGKTWWVLFAAPIAIGLATAILWFFDRWYLSERSEQAERPRALRWMLIVGLVELLLIAGITLAWWDGDIPDGLFFGTLWIIASAVAFLLAISGLRRAAPSGRSEHIAPRWWTIVLGVITLGGIITIWVNPMWVGRTFGSLIVACFAFGAILALANVFNLLAEALSHQAGTLGFDVGRRAVGAVFLCLLALLVGATSLARPFHQVRLCDQGCTEAAALPVNSWTAVPSHDKRPTVNEAALAWYQQARLEYDKEHPGKPVPMLIVATAGGGIRAAYWTATVLEQLEKDLGPAASKTSRGLLRHLLFAISGVSGGSLGAAAYAAAVHDHEVNKKGVTPTEYLKHDFLAPGLASWIFIDGPSNFLPDFGQISRGEALERAFENSSNAGLLSHKFLSFFPVSGSSVSHWRPILLLNATHQKTGRRIITSHVKAERHVFSDSYDALQVLQSDVRLSTAVHNSARFTYVSPAGNLLSAKTSNNESVNRGYIIDGGYLENYGALTAFEIARQAMEAIDPKKENKVKLVVLQISSDPSLTEGRTLVRLSNHSEQCSLSTWVSAQKPAAGQSTQGDQVKDPGNYLTIVDPSGGKNNEGEGYVLSALNELFAPIDGIQSVRGARGTIASAGLAAATCALNPAKDDKDKAPASTPQRVASADPSGTKASANAASGTAQFAHVAMCKESKSGRSVVPPLGWVLSEKTRGQFTNILDDCGNDQELKTLKAALGVPADAPSTAGAVGR